MLSQIGLPGIVLLLLVCMIAFGSKNLPKIGKSIGESLNEFKTALSMSTTDTEIDKSTNNLANKKEGEKHDTSSS